MFDAQLRFGEPGSKVKTVRHMAALSVAASLTEGFVVSGPIRFDTPPPQRTVGSKQRKSPSQGCLASGYDESTVVYEGHPDRTGHYFWRAVDRVRKAHKKALADPVSKQWLFERSYSLAKELYPFIPREVLAEKQRTSCT